jgi:hypothetical protein
MQMSQLLLCRIILTKQFDVFRSGSLISIFSFLLDLITFSTSWELDEYGTFMFSSVSILRNHQLVISCRKE